MTRSPLGHRTNGLILTPISLASFDFYHNALPTLVFPHASWDIPGGNEAGPSQSHAARDGMMGTIPSQWIDSPSRPSVDESSQLLSRMLDSSISRTEQRT